LSILNNTMNLPTTCIETLKAIKARDERIWAEDCSPTSHAGLRDEADFAALKILMTRGLVTHLDPRSNGTDLRPMPSRFELTWEGAAALDEAWLREQEAAEPAGSPVDRGLEWEELVLALIIGRGRDWSVDQLAEAVGKSRATLDRNAKINTALKTRRTGAVETGVPDGERRRLN